MIELRSTVCSMLSRHNKGARGADSDKVDAMTDPAYLLDGRPGAHDALGTHEDLADALIRLLREQPVGGRVVALEGPYGSGKSTVVQQFANRLDSDSERAIVFDSWAHQGDPLRRSFIETAAGQLMGDGDEVSAWLDRRVWTLRLDELAGRRRAATTTSKVEVLEAAKFATFGAMLVPLGGVLLAKNLDQPSISTVAVLSSIALILAPAWLAVLGVIFRLSSRQKRDDDTSRGIRWFDPVAGNASTETSTESWESGEPTSVEFEAMFRELMGNALQRDERRLIIVLDNLDRTSPGDALAILSTMQTFVGTSDHRRESWSDRLWLLIPFDRMAMARLWDGENVAGVGQVALDQFDKLFDVTLRVPPIRRSDWRELLEAMLDKALPSESDEARSEVATVFAAFRRERVADRKGIQPTVRVLKQLVNQIVAARIQRSDQIALPVIAYHELICRVEPDVEQWLLGPGPHGVEPIESATLRGELAALHFGRGVRDSVQLLLEEALTTSLRERDTERATSILEFPGAWEVAAGLEVEEWWGEKNGDEFGDAVETWFATGLCDLNSREVRRAIDRLVGSLERRASVRVHGDWAGRGIARLVDWPSRPLAPATVFAKLGDTAGSNAESDIDGRLDAIAAFLRVVRDSDPTYVPESIEVFVAIEDQVALLRSSIAVLDGADAGAVRSGAEVTSVDSALAEVVSTADDLQQLAQRSVALYPDHAWGATVDALTSLLDADPAPAVLARCLDTISVFGDVGATRLADWRSNGTLHHHLVVCAVDHSDAVSAARIVYEVHRDGFSLAPPPAVRRAAEGHTLLERVARAPTTADHELLDALAGLVTSRSDSEFIASLVNARPESDGMLAYLVRRLVEAEAGSVLSAEVLAENWGQLEGLVGKDDLWPATGFHRADGSFEGAALQVALGNGNASLALAVLARELDDAARVVDWIGRYLSDQAAVDWEAALSADADDRPLIVIKRVELGLPPDLDHRFEEALRSQALAVASGAEVPTRLARSLEMLVLGLDPTRRPVFVDRLTSSLATQESLPSEHFLATWGEVLARFATLANANAMLDLGAAAIASQDRSVMAWVSDVVDADPSLVERAAAERRTYLVQQLRDVFEELGDAATDEVRSAMTRLSEQVTA